MDLATIDDYAARYGRPDDPAPVEALISDASALLLSAYEARWGESYVEGDHPPFDRSCAAVACAMARRAMSAGAGALGATQYTQTAGPFSVSATASASAPFGGLYIARSERAALGLAGARVGQSDPWGGSR